MFFLVGESGRSKRTELGLALCPVCKESKPFFHLEIVNWFTFFGLPIARLERLAEYDECQQCKSSFQPGLRDRVAHHDLLLNVVAYFMNGYGLLGEPGLADEVSQKVAGIPFPEADLRRLGSTMADAEVLMSEIDERSSYFNGRAREALVAAAFLVTAAAVELKYEDKLRINQLGTALNLSLVSVNAICDDLRKRDCLGIKTARIS